MKTKITVTVIFLILGFVLAGIAIFADVFGLDQHAGWSMARIELLIFGALIMFYVILYDRYAEQIHILTCKIRIFIDNIPVQYFILPIVILVILIYVWFGSSGKWTTWKPSTFYYDSQARGFLKSDLYLPIEPDPQLLILPNPYDPSARAGIETPGDISFYKGKYYMYWGPVPALLLTAIYLFYHRPVGDFALTFGFVCGIFLLQTVLLFFLWKQYFRNLPQWTLYLSILLMGLACPLMLLRHNYEAARIYEASITGAQFFFMGGLLVSLTAVSRSSISGWQLAVAGVLWALAIGTRQIVAVPVGFMVLILSFWFFKINDWSFNRTTQLIPLGLPLAFGLVCLGWYNWVRFDSITETGLFYQFAGWNLREHYNELFSQLYIFQNLHNYLFNPIEFISKFPFVFMPKGSEIPMLSLYSVPEIYNAQPIAGLLYTFPFAIYSAIPLFELFFSLFNKRSAQISADANDRTHLNWITFALGGSSLIAFGLLMMFFWAGMRYWGDVTPSLMVLSVIGFWQGYNSLAHKPITRRLYIIFGLIFASASILLSMLLAISTNSGLVKFIINRIPFL
jgi:hypothetical protein